MKHVLIFCLVLLFAGATIVFAQAPPRNLEGEYHHGMVDLSWDHPPTIVPPINPPPTPPPPLKYNIYRKLNTDTSFSLLDSTMHQEYSDSVALNDSLWYYVTAKYPDSIESGPSNIIKLFSFPDTGHNSSHVQLQFVSTPPHMGTTGQLYTYDAQVVTNPPGLPVCFNLLNGPEGMTINDSGVVQWTPAHLGIYEVTIGAHICTNAVPGIRQAFFIFVLSGSPASITGNVQDTIGHGIPHVKIKVFDVNTGRFVYCAITDSVGNYSLSYVNPSTYYLHAEPDNALLLPQWYNGVNDIHDATPVVVQDSQTVTVNFTLHARDTVDNRFLLSGTVWDSSTHPIPGALVTIFRTGHDSSTSADVFDDHHNDCDPVRMTTTDSSGNYSFKLLHGTYIVTAQAKGFLPQFWNHQSSPLDANQIYLTGDTAGINFNLIAKLPSTGSISGVIHNAQDSSGLKSHVIGFHRDGSGRYTGFTVSTFTDSTGSYTLDHLPAGNFYVLALAGKDFFPTFYSLNGGTPFLDSASTVAVSGGAVNGIDIYAIPDTIGGLNCVKGHIHTGQSAGPVDGALVTVINNLHQVVGADVSAADGSYLVAGIPPGSYSLLFQKPGMTETTLPTTTSYVNASPSTVSADAQLNPLGGSGGPYTTLNVQPRWNLVSIPVTVSDLHQKVVFPGAVSNAFQFTSSGYAITSVLSYGQGYWIEYSGTNSIIISGTQMTTQSISLSAGWNLIGSISSSVPVSSISTTPAGIITSNLFGYATGYAPATSVDPGRGYWVKASAPGTLVLSSTASSPKVNTEGVLSQLNSMTITDATGSSQTLYFGPQRNTINVQAYELPPVGPSGSFDARFNSQQMVELHPLVLKTASSYPISLQSAQAPLTVKWSVSTTGYGYKLTDASGKLITTMNGQGSAKVSASGTSLILSAQPVTVPKEFALHQNYPNPFNPSTEIAFDLPTASTVTLKIYNILGQEVFTLLNNESVGAGSHAYRFDASNLSSGIYFYKIQAGSFDAVRKMMLVK